MDPWRWQHLANVALLLSRIEASFTHAGTPQESCIYSYFQLSTQQRGRRVNFYWQVASSNPFSPLWRSCASHLWTTVVIETGHKRSEMDQSQIFLSPFSCFLWLLWFLWCIHACSAVCGNVGRDSGMDLLTLEVRSSRIIIISVCPVPRRALSSNAKFLSVMAPNWLEPCRAIKGGMVQRDTHTSLRARWRTMDQSWSLTVFSLLCYTWGRTFGRPESPLFTQLQGIFSRSVANYMQKLFLFCFSNKQTEDNWMVSQPICAERHLMKSNVWPSQVVHICWGIWERRRDELQVNYKELNMVTCQSYPTDNLGDKEQVHVKNDAKNKQSST